MARPALRWAPRAAFLILAVQLAARAASGAQAEESLNILSPEVAARAVNGFVTKAGKPEPGVEVRIVVEKEVDAGSATLGHDSTGHPSRFEILASMKTNTKGEFEFELPLGTKASHVQARKGELGNFMTPISSTPETWIEVQLRPVALLSGRVTGPRDYDLTQGSVTIRSPEPDGIFAWEDLPLALGKRGEFSFRLDVRADAMNPTRQPAIFAEAPGYAGMGPFLDSMFGEADSNGMAAPLPEDERQNIKVQLKPLASGGFVFVDREGAPLANHRVRVMPDLGLTDHARFWAPFGIAGTTDEVGALKYANAWPAKHFGTIDGDKIADALVLDPTYTIETDPQVKLPTVSGRRYFGKVVDEEGKPIEAAAIMFTTTDAFGQISAEMPGKIFTDAQGVYSIEDRKQIPKRMVFYKPGRELVMFDQLSEISQGVEPAERIVTMRAIPARFTRHDAHGETIASEMPEAMRDSLNEMYNRSAPPSASVPEPASTPAQ